MAGHRGKVLLGATTHSQKPGAASQDADEVRVAELVHQHFDFIWRLLRRLGAAEPEDAAQRVFTIAWMKLAQIQTTKERAFLVGIATNVAAEQRRARSRRRETNEEPPDLADPSLDQSELLDQREACRVVDGILERLPADLREVFVLFEVEELTMREISEGLGLPSGTVASRLRRAREAFHLEIDRCWPPIAKKQP